MIIRSDFKGNQLSMQQSAIQRVDRSTQLQVESKVHELKVRKWVPLGNQRCIITGKRRSKARRRTKGHGYHAIDFFRYPNIRCFKVWWEEGQRQVFLHCSVKGWKIVMQQGIEKVAQKQGINLNRLDFIDWSPEAIAFRKRYGGDYLPYEMTYGPPFNRKLKDPEKVANAERLLVRKWVNNRIVEAFITQEEAVQNGVMPDMCYKYLPPNLKRDFSRVRQSWYANQPLPPKFDLREMDDLVEAGEESGLIVDKGI